MLEKIEENAFGHFRYLPKLGGFSVQESEILTIINCGLGSPMFNIVYSTHLADWARKQQEQVIYVDSPEDTSPHISSNQNGDEFIKNKVLEIIDDFKGQPFAWWMAPSCNPPWLTNLLLDVGFKIHNTEHLMVLDFSEYQNINDSPDLHFEQVANEDHLDDFISIFEYYDPSARHFYEKIKPRMLQGKEILFVGYRQGTPVTTGALFYRDDTAGIYNLRTDKDQRGLGYASQMMHHLINIAQTTGSRYITLSASSYSGYKIYEQMGFKIYGKVEDLHWGNLDESIDSQEYDDA